MRGRLGLVIGFAAGYVLGTKAGHQRYEEIRDSFNRLMGTEPAQQLQAEVRQAAQRAGEVIETKTSEGISKVSDTINDKVGNGNGSSGQETPTDASSGLGTQTN